MNVQVGTGDVPVRVFVALGGSAKDSAGQLAWMGAAIR
jgi:hypothetical protein